MSFNDIDDLFRIAFGEQVTTFDYQARLAGGSEGTACESKLINVPTGCGKTAAVVLAWIWNRVTLRRADWPRRLIYCLPMRTLVEQTRDNVRQWLKNLGDLEWDGENAHTGKVGVHILMGGEGKIDWDLYPEHHAILIGTQDMLVSRALNRGYGMSRYRWPMHFGLLNNDCLWVLDETQLMGVSVETSAQLDAFRAAETFGKCPTWWMSATLDRAQLNTVDHREPKSGWPSIILGESDLASATVRKRIEARKTLSAAPLALTAETKKDYAKRLAEFIFTRHQNDTLTLVVVNRVARARAIYSALRKSGMAKGNLALIHSRFRPPDREKHAQLLKATGDRIVIATQAVEAGVDVSARLLITELAPWSSLVQRFGRCNRGGEFVDDAEVVWIEVETSNEDLARPYTAQDLDAAREGLKQVGSDVGAALLKNISVPMPRVVRPVLRRKDLLDLFDTTPDLCGNDLDISRYIRDDDDTDVQVFWRALPDGEPDEETPAPDRRELCRVSLADFAKFLGAKTKPKAFVWDVLEEEWQQAMRARPGGVYLVTLEGGGYSDDLGWTRELSDKPTDLHTGKNEPDSNDANPETFVGRWISLQDHTYDVVKATTDLVSALALTNDEIAALRTAARWHDTGKAHPAFQQMLRNGSAAPDSETIWAKSASGRGGRARKGFRHELASALAWLVGAPADAAERDLVAFLIAAHHGKVRLSIRALPNEDTPDGASDRLHARGVWDGEELPRIPLPDGAVGPVKLDLSFMQMGTGPHGPSWLSRMLSLRDQLGPFRLAYLETLLRVADMRASALETSIA